MIRISRRRSDAVKGESTSVGSSYTACGHWH